MPLRFGINGFGRIGRALLRIVLTREDLRPHLAPAAVNDIVPAPVLARLLARDTVQGRFSLPVGVEDGALLIGDLLLPVFQEPDPARVPWEGIEVVVEATGRFLPRSRAAAHLRNGVRTVVLSANGDPQDPVDATLCLGILEEYKGQEVISNASCTTNALALMAKVLHDRFGVRRALMNTVHSYTENQRLLDLPHPDPRRSRAAALNIIPTSTTAAEAAGLLLPGLAGRIDGFAVRVPTPAVAMLDLVADLERKASPEEIRQAYEEAAGGPLAGLLGTTADEPVSSDFVGDPRSVVIDLPLIQAVDGLVRVVGWYDNEWGYANRLAELLARLATRSERGGSDPHV
ncbi:MAG TPA: glyceraldehyde 3-phosphate dehydrogenase NAD-binding domain-containing protein [Thermoanaerobaculia bacterium]|jgi:glyceraldehyde 3-phosphate dehydrogenase|nr:glyceraldehyde 3-phosphate dehydrogenase NAD-binding domain-containing protein [Thermoanaerobaculia bacterium]